MLRHGTRPIADGPDAIRRSLQESVLGPILILLYTADLALLVESHLYADETQVYGLCKPSSADQLQMRMLACTDDIAGWICRMGYSSTPQRQWSCGAHQRGDRVTCLLYYSKCPAIRWHHLQSFVTWTYVCTQMSVWIPTSSHTASVFWGSCAAFVVCCPARSSSLLLLHWCWQGSTSLH